MKKHRNRLTGAMLASLLVATVSFPALANNKDFTLAKAVPGARVISAEDGRLLDWAKAETESRKLRKRAKRLAEDLEI